jgi:L-lysine exporter family protein LysE/ArgO
MISDPPWAAMLAGLAFGMSLIVALGAQNIFVLRQGFFRNHVMVVVMICIASDAVLIAAGVAGLGALVHGQQVLLTPVRVLGAAAVITYGAMAASRAFRRPALHAEAAPPMSPVRAVAAACLAFTWLNPAVYLDILVLGSVANTHGSARWSFAAGATTGSVIWFFALGFGARLMAPLFRRPVAWRALDCFTSIVMAATAVRVLSGI